MSAAELNGWTGRVYERIDRHRSASCIVSVVERGWIGLTQATGLIGIAQVTVVPIVGLADLLCGVVSSFNSLLFAGVWEDETRSAQLGLGGAGLVLQKVFLGFLKIINPWVRADGIGQAIETEDGSWYLYSSGLFSQVGRRMSIWIDNKVTSHNNLFVSELGSRFFYIARLPAMLVLRTADAVVGLGAATISLATFGCFSSLNNVAARGLSAPRGLTVDLHYTVLRAINPRARVLVHN